MAKLPLKYQPWVEARTRFHLSHAVVQMARELGLNPKKFGSLANHGAEPWKAPLPEFIAKLYRKHFGKAQPDDVRPLEEIVAGQKAKKVQRQARRKALRDAEPELGDIGAAPGTAVRRAAPADLPAIKQLLDAAFEPSD